MKVFVIGGGGREHAIVWKIAKSPLVDNIYCAPGNGGIEELAECIPIKPDNIPELLKFSKDMDLIIVGPEIPLADGIVNELPENKVFGPTKEAATIESDKSFSKGLMKRAGIPTALFETFNNVADAKNFIQEAGYPLVIKASGLAAGKGVFIVKDKKDAVDILTTIMVDKKFGSAGDKIVIEEYLEGEEVSVLAFTDGKDFVPLLPCQDNKKLLDGDKGPNTGGMGAYARAVLSTQEVENVIEKILAPCVWGLKKGGIIYKGVLYGGLIITENGPEVLEFNCRFGDPETQPVLPLLKTDLMEPILATIEGNLKSISLKWEDKYATCVVSASRGYPGAYKKGKEIIGLNEVHSGIIFHAGTERKGEKIVTSGGRVLGVVGLGKSLKEATDITYKEVAKIHFDGMHYRKDIG